MKVGNLEGPCHESAVMASWIDSFSLSYGTGPRVPLRNRRTASNARMAWAGRH